MKTVVRTVRDVDLLALSYQPQCRNHDLPAKHGRTIDALLSLLQLDVSADGRKTVFSSLCFSESVLLKAYFLSKTKQAFGSHEWLK